tara:strand:- start:131 stop:367 length:237 start_codon:yes stop_codon:yes gene_type:complete
MQSITINFKDHTIYKHVIWFLSRFSSAELEVVDTNLKFEDVKKQAQADYQAMISHKTKLHSVAEVDTAMENIITSYEA